MLACGLPERIAATTTLVLTVPMALLVLLISALTWAVTPFVVRSLCMCAGLYIVYFAGDDNHE